MCYTWPGQTGFQKVIARFEALHPGIKVKQSWLAWNNYWQKVETQAVAGQPADVFINDPGYMEQFANKGLLMPLDSFFAKDHLSLDQFYTPAVNQVRWSPTSLGTGKGPLMSFPWDYQAGIWVYNKTMFKAAGVPLPKVGWTWADVLDAAKKLTKTDASGKATQYGILAPSDTSHDLLLLNFAMDGRYWSPDLKKIDITNPGFTKAMQFSHDLIYKYKVAPQPNAQSQVDLFMTGKVAMWSTGTWICPPIRTSRSSSGTWPPSPAAPPPCRASTGAPPTSSPSPRAARTPTPPGSCSSSWSARARASR